MLNPELRSGQQVEGLSLLLFLFFSCSSRPWSDLTLPPPALQECAFLVLWIHPLERKAARMTLSGMVKSI